MNVLVCSRVPPKLSLECSRGLTGPHGAPSTAYLGDGYWSLSRIDVISNKVHHKTNIDLVLSSLMAFDMALQMDIDFTMHSETVFYTDINEGRRKGV